MPLGLGFGQGLGLGLELGLALGLGLGLGLRLGLGFHSFFISIGAYNEGEPVRQPSQNSLEQFIVCRASSWFVGVSLGLVIVRKFTKKIRKICFSHKMAI